MDGAFRDECRAIGRARANASHERHDELDEWKRHAERSCRHGARGHEENGARAPNRAHRNAACDSDICDAEAGEEGNCFLAPLSEPADPTIQSVDFLCMVWLLCGLAK